MAKKIRKEIELCEEESSGDENPSLRLTISGEDIQAKDDIFSELMSEQIEDIPDEWKLSLSDIKRICKYIDVSIFNRDQCCLWKGYVTNVNNSSKGMYVNFFFRNKKIALHRLLYSNYVSPLTGGEYLKFKCENRGVCCNINHYEKYRYSGKGSSEPKSKRKLKKDDTITITSYDILVDFD